MRDLPKTNWRTRLQRDPFYYLKFTLLDAPDLQLIRARRHWAFRHRNDKKWKEAVQAMCQAVGLPAAPLEQAYIKIVLSQPTAVDYDNLVSSMKPVIDGLKPLRGYKGVIRDDSMAIIGSPLYVFQRESDKFVQVEVGERPMPEWP